MNESKALTCPNCGNPLECTYYAGDHKVGCEECGLRGPRAATVGGALDLFTRHCTHAAELDVLRAINAEQQGSTVDGDTIARVAALHGRLNSALALLREAVEAVASVEFPENWYERAKELCSE